jgi:MFS family permease
MSEPVWTKPAPKPNGTGVAQRPTQQGHRSPVPTAMRFVVFLGIVSLFADMTYESARSLYGPFLAHLGASAFAVSIVAGTGELLGYGLRLLSGRFSDKTKRYWAITIVGYFISLLSVPALALAASWPVAVGLVLAERVGKAIRKPARDAMLSSATQQIGTGWGFGVHQAMDQTGALVGPILVAIVIAHSRQYRSAFAFLVIPATLSILFLLMAKNRFPRPHDLEIKVTNVKTAGISRTVWVYTIGAGLIGVGYVDFPLVAFHFARHSLFRASVIPLTYALGMGTAAVAALLFGHLLDKVGFFSTIVGAVAASAFAPMIFLGNTPVAIVGMTLWGFGLGIQESSLRAFLGKLVSSEHRASAYGLFDAAFGVCWFAGSAIVGGLYEISLTALVAFSVAAQLASVPLLLWVGRRYNVAQL